MDAALPTATDDQALLDELRRAVTGADPVPLAVQVAARAALAWGAFEAEFAALVTAGRSG